MTQDVDDGILRLESLTYERCPPFPIKYKITTSRKEDWSPQEAKMSLTSN